MSEYPKEMMVSTCEINISNKGLKRLVLFKDNNKYYALSRKEYNVENLIQAIKNEEHLCVSIWDYAIDIPKPKKRPMNIYEFQKFCIEKNPMIRLNGFTVWESYISFCFDEETEFSKYQYKLQDGTVGEFEVEE